MITKVTCNGTRAKCLHEIELTAGMAGAPIAFEFSPEWDGLTKIAVFTSDGSRDVILDESGKTTVPHEILTTPGMDVTAAVFARREDGTTWPSPSLVCKIGRVKFGADPSGDESYPPTPTVGEQAIALAGQASEDAKAAREAAQTAEKAAAQAEEAAQGASQAAESAQEDAEKAANDAQTAKLLVQAATAASTKAKESAQAAEDAAKTAEADAENAKQQAAIAADVKNRADRGEFDGGYYTPVLNQQDGESFKMEFTPSKEGMPSVESQPVQLPKVIMLEKGEPVPNDLPPGQLFYTPDEEGITPEEEVVLHVLKELDIAPVVLDDDGTLVTEDDGTVIIHEGEPDNEDESDVQPGIQPPATAKVGQTIVVKAVDENGKPTEWEAADYQPRTHWSELVEVFPETPLAVEDGIAFTEFDDIYVAGKEYKVTFNGKEYVCTAVDDGGVVVIGNLDMLKETGDNGMPFASLWEDGLGFIVFDGSTSITVSVVEVNYVPIPVQYVTNALPYYIEVTGDGTDSNPLVCNETVANVEAIYKSGRPIKVKFGGYANSASMFPLALPYGGYIMDMFMFVDPVLASETSFSSYGYTFVFFCSGIYASAKNNLLWLSPNEDGTYSVSATGPEG